MGEQHLLLNKLLWKKIFFTDERRFSLDGPDGCSHYWADKRVEQFMRMNRHSGGGGVMVWGCSYWLGKPKLVVLKNTINC